MKLIRFLLVGLVNTFIGLGTTFIAMYLLEFTIIRANVLGYTIGILCSFALNKTWTFGSSDHIGNSFLRFLLVTLVAYLTNLGTVLMTSEGLHINPYIAQTLGIVPYAIVGFIGNRYFVFRKQKDITTVL